MYKIAKPIFLIAETAVHPGSGSDLGYIDNPIQREVHTGYPKIEGSSLKGALRQAFEIRSANKDYWIKLNRVFGYDEDLPKDIKEDVEKYFGDKKDFAGAIAFTDARILLFPVKSLKGTFAWITCPRVLAKFKQELDLIKELQNLKKEDENKSNEKNQIDDKLYEVNINGENKLVSFNFTVSEKVLITTNSKLKFENESKIQLNEYIYEVEKNKEVDTLAKWLKKNVFFDNGQEISGINIGDIEKNLVIVSDDDFAYFVKYGTEVATRIKIDNETGTVKEGALFTVEYLPSETVMYSLVMFAPEFRKNDNKRMTDKDVKNFFNENKPSYFQLGGDATLGKGIFRLTVLNSKNQKNG